MDRPDTPLQFLPGIGPAKAAILAGRGLHTLRDLVLQVPRLQGPPPPLCDQGPLPSATEVRVRARLVSTRPSFARGRRGGLDSIWERSDGRRIQARFFQAGWLRRHLIPGEWYLLEGRTDAQAGDRLLHPAFTHLARGEATPLPEAPGLRVAYRIPEGIGERRYLDLVERALAVADAIADPAGRLDAAAFGAALRRLHHPTDAADHEDGRRVLAEREVLAFAWRLGQRRAGILAQPGQAWRWDDGTDARARARLPFALTPGQEAVLAEVRRDLRADRPMYRLVQGDVGSGKTAIAFLAALAVIADGAQVLLLAPTALLARQHQRTFTAWLAGSRVRCDLLTGGTPPDERAGIAAALADGSCHLLVGTHALFDDDLRPRRCGLVVIDEQHRFGVDQRARLADRRGPDQDFRADLLALTATPIPRTLALTAFGDLAISRVVGRPPGRGAVTTRIEAWAGLETLVRHIGPRDGGRTFVICQLREEGDEQRHDAVRLARDLRPVLGDRLALVHGGLGEAAKQAALDAFAAGTSDVLVATSVIEVGIDVAEADRLIIVDADGFGLASLHQMRGRIGRGARPGLCLCLHRQVSTPERLALLATHEDGLALAEADLRLRGAGDLLGTDQHGRLPFHAADLDRDLDLLLDAHAAVAADLARGRCMPPGLEAFAAEAISGG